MHRALRTGLVASRVSRLVMVVVGLPTGPGANWSGGMACELVAGRVRAGLVWCRVVTSPQGSWCAPSLTRGLCVPCLSRAQAFEDAYRSPLAVVVLDGIERLVSYVKIGPRFSNEILQVRGAQCSRDKARWR